jgi:hypothetical protein
MPGLGQVALFLVGVTDADVNIAMGSLKIQGAHPAEDRLIVQPAQVEAAPHVVIAIGAILLVQTGGVEHFLSLLMIAPLGKGNNAVAVGRLEGWIDLLDSVEGFDCLIEPAGAEEVEAEVIEGLNVAGVDLVGLLVGLEGLLIAAHLVEYEPHVEEPGRVVGIDICSETDFAQRFGPFALLKELLGLFDPSLGVAPVVHNPLVRVLNRTPA